MLVGVKMEKAYFPLFVDLSEKKIIIVGGGKIAARRAAVLTRFASDITVIAPEFSEAMENLAAEQKVRCKRRMYKAGDISSADLVLAATNDRALNRRIAGECRELERSCSRRILLSVADDRSLCDFYFPSVIQKDEIVIGINSGGSDPGKVKKFREELEKKMEL